MFSFFVFWYVLSFICCTTSSVSINKLMWKLMAFKTAFSKFSTLIIDCIYVKENGDIKIKFKFEDEFKRCLEYIENNKITLEKLLIPSLYLLKVL